MSITKEELFDRALAAIDNWNAIGYDEMFTDREKSAKETMDLYYEQIEQAGLMDEFTDYAEA